MSRTLQRDLLDEDSEWELWGPRYLCLSEVCYDEDTGVFINYTITGKYNSEILWYDIAEYYSQKVEL
jgi:hypothetical protein